MDQSLLRMKKHRGFVKLSGCVTGQLNKQEARAECYLFDVLKTFRPHGMTQACKAIRPSACYLVLQWLG
jgi:hypothetical protein